MAAGDADGAVPDGPVWTMTVVSVDASSADLAAEVLRSLGASAVEEREVVPDVRAGGPGGTRDSVELWSFVDQDATLTQRLVDACGPRVSWRTERVARSVAETWREHAVAVKVGSLLVAPSWRAVAPTHGETVVTVDPEHLFGLGDHPTTRGVLEMLLADDGATGARRPGRSATVVDAGCGSGIVGIAVAVEARRRGATAPVIAGFDIAPGTAAVVARNCRRNFVDTYHVVEPDAIADGWADTTVANILAPALRELAPTLGRVTAPCGELILGGMRSDQWAAVAACFPDWSVERRSVTAGWHTLRLVRSGASRVNSRCEPEPRSER